VEPLYCDDPMAVYLNEIRRVPPLSHAEECLCIKRVCAGGEQAKIAAKRLVEAHLGLVVSIAEQYTNTGINMLDLVQTGNSGLTAAIEGLPSTGADSFNAFATPYVHRTISTLIDGSDSFRA
jgi:RNA polymerase primary sigma factor